MEVTIEFRMIELLDKDKKNSYRKIELNLNCDYCQSKRAACWDRLVLEDLFVSSILTCIGSRTYVRTCMYVCSLSLDLSESAF